MICGLCNKEGNAKRWIAYDINMWNFFIEGNKKAEKFKLYFGCEKHYRLNDFWYSYTFCDSCRPILRKAKKNLNVLQQCKIIIYRIQKNLKDKI
jgi:hypothetical protein